MNNHYKFMLSMLLVTIMITVTLSFSANAVKKAKRIQQETLNMIDSKSITNVTIEIHTNNDIYYCDFNNNIITSELGKRLLFANDLEMKDFIAETTANESK